MQLVFDCAHPRRMTNRTKDGPLLLRRLHLSRQRDLSTLDAHLNSVTSTRLSHASSRNTACLISSAVMMIILFIANR